MMIFQSVGPPAHPAVIYLTVWVAMAAAYWVGAVLTVFLRTLVKLACLVIVILTPYNE